MIKIEHVVMHCYVKVLIARDDEDESQESGPMAREILQRAFGQAIDIRGVHNVFWVGTVDEDGAFRYFDSDYGPELLGSHNTPETAQKISDDLEEENDV